MLLKDDLRSFLTQRYAQENLTASEITSIIRRLEAYPAADFYASNKQIHTLVADGFLFKREDHTQKTSTSSSLTTAACLSNTNPDQRNWSISLLRIPRL